MGTVAVETINNPRTETFYWIAITFSQTLGTAFGDWTSNVAGFGFAGGAIFFVILLAVLAMLCYATNISRVFLFWTAFILTRPLGATFGDLLDKPLHSGGLDMKSPGDFRRHTRLSWWPVCWYCHSVPGVILVDDRHGQERAAHQPQPVTGDRRGGFP